MGVPWRSATTMFTATSRAQTSRSWVRTRGVHHCVAARNVASSVQNSSCTSIGQACAGTPAEQLACLGAWDDLPQPYRCDAYHWFNNVARLLLVALGRDVRRDNGLSNHGWPDPVGLTGRRSLRSLWCKRLHLVGFYAVARYPAQRHVVGYGRIKSDSRRSGGM